MKNLHLLFLLAFLSLANLPAFAQQEEYAFIDIDYKPKKLLIVVTKGGSSTKTEVTRPEGDVSVRTEIVKFMNALNQEGYQLYSMSPYIFPMANGAALSEAYVFVRKK